MPSRFNREVGTEENRSWEAAGTGVTVPTGWARTRFGERHLHGCRERPHRPWLSPVRAPATRAPAVRRTRPRRWRSRPVSSSRRGCRRRRRSRAPWSAGSPAGGRPPSPPTARRDRSARTRAGRARPRAAASRSGRRRRAAGTARRPRGGCARRCEVSSTSIHSRRPLPPPSTTSRQPSTVIRGLNSISPIRYDDMVADRSGRRTRMVTLRANRARWIAAWPAELPPPTTKTS